MVRDRSYIWRDGGSTSLLQAGKYQIKKNKMNYLMLSCRLPSIVYLRRPGCDVITGLRESEFAGDHLSLGNLYSQLPPAGDSFSGLQTTWEKHGRAAAGGGEMSPPAACKKDQAAAMIVLTVKGITGGKKRYLHDACSCKHHADITTERPGRHMMASGRQVVKVYIEEVKGGME